MIADESKGTRRRGWTAHLCGHLLLFDRAPATEISARAGSRLLLAAVGLEIVRVASVAWLWPHVPLLLLLPALLALALWSAPRVAGFGLARLGLRPWREWTTTEKSYFVQVVVLANVVFPLVLGSRAASAARPEAASSLLGFFVPYLCFGFYQEIVYRGMVQPELVRRWGAPIGILAANVLFTFGPLHWQYFTARAALAVPMLAAIFAVGLYFGTLYRRSGNLWLPAVFHAIGNAYMVWGTSSSE